MTAGAGAVKLVLLPGLDGTGRMFGPLLGALPPDLDRVVIAYPPETFLHCTDLADLVARQVLREPDVVILAESYSGLVCLELLKRGLPQIKGVVFAACFAAPPRPLLLELARLLPLARIMGIRQPAWLIKRYCLGHDAEPAAIRLLRDALSAVKPNVLAERLRELSEPRSLPGRIALPCCYIQATEDRLVPNSAVEAFTAMAPNLDIHRVVAPHFVLQARPRECAEIVCAFVRRRIGPSAAAPPRPRS